MKKKISAALLAAALIISILSMSSCGLILSGSSSYMTREEVENLIQGGMNGNITVEGGDYNEITINGAESDVAVAGKALLSAVSIDCTFDTYSSSYYPGIPTLKQKKSSGSGVIYRIDKEKGDAYIITNYHVVYYSGSNTENGISGDIRLYLYGQEASEYAIPAVYVGGSMNYDIAVLKVSGSRVIAESNAVAADFADSDNIAVLDKAIAIGNPEDLGISATLGYINVDSEYITMQGADGVTEIKIRVMRMDTAVNSGNSGGGLFDREGRLIGVVNAKLTDSENMSYAIPSNFVKYAADNIIYYCDGKSEEKVSRCLLGITVSATEMYTEYDRETGRVVKRETVGVSMVSEGSLADGALLVGDIINSVKIDGREYKVTRMFVVTDAMLNARAGSEVVISVERDGESVDVKISITEDCIKSIA